MKKFIFPAFLLICFVLLKMTLSSSSGGITGSTSGCSCHAANSTSTVIGISGFPANYVNNQAYTITASVTNSTKLAAGFDFLVSAGTLSAAPANTIITNSFHEINHTLPKNMISGTTTWTFTWTAPSSGNATVTVNMAGNAVNLASGSSGDTPNIGSLSVPGTVIPLAVTASNGVIQCNGGTVNIGCTGSGGTTPYQYKRNTGAYQSSNLFTGNTAGTYTITIKDATNATASTVKVINQPTLISTTTSQNNVSCYGGTNGNATVTPSGGASSSYTYAWAPSGGSAATANGLTQGTYTCTVTDANNCTKSTTVTITQPTAVQANIVSSTNVTCFGGSNGSANVIPSGGSVGYTYTWLPSGGSAASATGLSAGVYTCVVSDANSCSGTASITIFQQSAVDVLANASSTSACGGNTVTLYGSNSANNTTYQYVWSGGVTNNIPFTALATTTYTVTGTSTSTGCSDNDIIVITVNTNNNPIARATAGNANSVAGTTCVTMNSVDGTIGQYTTTACNAVVSIQDIAGGSTLGSVTTCVDVLAAIPTHNGQPYVARNYTITPQTQTAANVTLYFTHDDILDYNNYITASSSSFPQFILPNVIPQNGDVISNASISKVNGALGASVGTAFPVTLIYDAAKLVWKTTFAVSSFSSFYLHTTNANNIPLDVKLVSFSGKNVSQAQAIHWDVDQEVNIANYILEYSTDAIHFKELTRLPAKWLLANNATSFEYDYVNNSIVYGHNYYQLKTTDIGGQVMRMSDVIDIEQAIDNETSSVLTLFPNPTETGLIQVSYTSSQGGKAELTITDIAGRKLIQQDFNFASGTTLSSINTEVLPSGQYWLKLRTAKGSQMVKPFTVK